MHLLFAFPLMAMYSCMLAVGWLHMKLWQGLFCMTFVCLHRRNISCIVSNICLSCDLDVLDCFIQAESVHLRFILSVLSSKLVILFCERCQNAGYLHIRLCINGTTTLSQPSSTYSQCETDLMQHTGRTAKALGENTKLCARKHRTYCEIMKK